MKIKITHPFVSSEGSFPVGDEVEVSDEFATELLNAGFAQPVKKAKKEKAVKDGSETPEGSDSPEETENPDDNA